MTLVHRRAAVLLLLLAPWVAGAEETTYALDPVHTRVMFAVSHAGFSNPMGTISGTTGTLVFDPDDWSKARVEAEIPLQRLDLGDEKWNARGARDSNFLDAQAHPVATFVSTRVEPIDATHATVIGMLTLRGVSREVQLDVVLHQAQAPSDAAVPPHRGLLRHGHAEPQGVRDHRVAERGRRRGRDPHRSRRHAQAWRRRTRGSATSTTTLLRRPPRPRCRRPPRRRCPRRPDSRARIQRHHRRNFRRATHPDMSDPMPDRSPAPRRFRNVDRWGAGQPVAALADRGADPAMAVHRPDDDRAAQQPDKIRMLRAAQVDRADHPRAGGAAPAVAPVRRHAAADRRHAALAGSASPALIARRAVRAAVRDAAERLGAEFRRRLPAAVVRPVQPAGASPRSDHDLHELAEDRARIAVLDADRCWRWCMPRAALYHHLFQHDATLARMLPRGWLPAPPPTEELRDALIVRPRRVVARRCAGAAAVAGASPPITCRRRARRCTFAGTYQGEVFTGRFPGFAPRCRFDPKQLAIAQARRDDPARQRHHRQRGLRQRNARRRVLRQRASSRRRATPRRSSARSAATATPPTAR